MIAFLIISAILLAILQNRVLNNSLEGVEYSSVVSKKLVAPDEKFEVIITITNKSRRFIPFIKMEHIFPEEMVMEEPKKTTTFMLPRSKYVKRIHASLPSRGSYYITSAYLHGGDFLGITEKTKNYRFVNEIVVYPKKTNERELELMSKGILGEISVKRFMIEDPLLTIGFREYTGREPMKHIDWNQSAKSNEIIVKQFDYTIDPSVTVILDVTEKIEDEKVELLFSMTRTVTEQLTNMKVKFSFLTNATILNKWYYINENVGSEHLNVILDLLGRATYSYSINFNSLIRSNEIEENSLVILISSKTKADLKEEINFLNARGIKIYLA